MTLAADRLASRPARPGLRAFFPLVLAIVLGAARAADGSAPLANELWGGPAARGGGVGATFDSTITVMAPTGATGTVDFWNSGTLVQTVSFSLPAWGVAILPTPDALVGLGPFLYHVRSDNAVTAWSETYNDTPSGRFGLSIGSFVTSDFLNPGDEASGGGVDASSSTAPGRARTNVGLLCSPNGTDLCQVEVAAFGGGVLLGTGILTGPPGSAAQQSLAGLIPAAAEQEGLALRFRVLLGSAEPYAIQNDNQSSDGSLLPLSVTRGSFSTAPVIVSFTLSPTTGCAPLTTTATWSTTGAAFVTITGIAGSLPPSGTYPVIVPSTSDILLTAVAPSGATSVMSLRVNLSAATDPPTPLPPAATLVPGAVATGVLPPSVAGQVTVSFTQQQSTGSTFVITGSSWTYTAGSTTGTDFVQLTTTGVCGPASATFTATVVAPGAPAVVSFTSLPTRGCNTTGVVLLWQTVNTSSVTISGAPFSFAPNGAYGVVINSTTTFTLRATGLVPGEYAVQSLTVPVDTSLVVPVVSPPSFTTSESTVTVVTVTGVPDPTQISVMYLQNESGSHFTITGVPGTFSYLAGPFPGTDKIQIFYTNGCGTASTELDITVQ